MPNRATSDRFTVIAIALIAYATANISHEILGHCTMAALLGTKCTMLSSTNIPLATYPPAWKYNIIVIAGSAANWIVGLFSFGLLRALRTTRTTRTTRTSPALRYFLWLTMCLNLFLPSTYMTVAPLIKFGDAYILIQGLPGEWLWRIVLVITGGAICLFSFQLCRKELSRLIGASGRAGRAIAWQLTVPAYLAGGVVTVMSGLFSPLDWKVAQLQAAGGTFGLTAWLLLLPLVLPEAPLAAQHSFMVPRSIGWIVAGALIGFVFIAVLGPGIAM